MLETLIAKYSKEINGELQVTGRGAFLIFVKGLHESPTPDFCKECLESAINEAKQRGYTRHKELWKLIKNPKLRAAKLDKALDELFSVFSKDMEIVQALGMAIPINPSRTIH